jgi:hypothetical protein
LNSIEHSKLCKDLDFILIKGGSPQIVANKYLHITNTHSDNLKKYQNSSFKALKLLIYFNLINLIKVLQSLYKRKQYYTHVTPPESEVLFVSHLNNNNQIYQDHDMYFGNLIYELKSNNINASIALINHTKIDNQELYSKHKHRKISKFILSPYLDLLSEIKLYYSQIQSFQKLKSIVDKLNKNKNFKSNLLSYHFSPETLSAIRISRQVSSIAKKIDAKIIITTYEGHAWERLSYYYARKSLSNVKCFGYQHAAIFKYQHAIQRALNKQYNPDFIFTSGVMPESIFKKKMFDTSIISCLGSPKYMDRKSLIVSDSHQCCLVAPQGIISECISLFELSLAYAEKNMDQKFIWRLHPFLSFNKVRKYSKVFNKIPENIFISQEGLNDDIQRCDSILYRGSTVVINAINAGLKPIYYKQSIDELSIDPIHGIVSGKFIVYNTLDFHSALHKKVAMQERLELQDFAQDYYTPLNVQNFFKFMKVCE